MSKCVDSGDKRAVIAASRHDVYSGVLKCRHHEITEVYSLNKKGTKLVVVCVSGNPLSPPRNDSVRTLSRASQTVLRT
jgi:hypothetical protein